MEKQHFRNSSLSSDILFAGENLVFLQITINALGEKFFKDNPAEGRCHSPEGRFSRKTGGSEDFSADFGRMTLVNFGQNL